MIRRRLSVALVAAASTSLALVTPVHAETAPGEQEQSVSSLSSGSSGSSGEGDTTPEENGENGEELPGWVQSAVLDDDSLLAIEVIKAVLAVGLAVTQAAVVVLPFVPGGTDQLRDFLASSGIQG